MSVRVVHFTAPWCSPCEAVARLLAELAPAFPDVSFEEIDLDERPEDGARYGVLALPTVVIEREGVEAARVEGARSRADYARALAEVLPPPE